MLDLRNSLHPSFAPSFAGPLSIWVLADGGHHVVRLDGELDVASRGLVLLTCAAVEHRVVTVDLAHLTFMDCAGYSGLVAARLVLEARGGSLTLADVTGQPQHLLTLLDGLTAHCDADDLGGPDRCAQSCGEITATRRLAIRCPTRMRTSVLLRRSDPTSPKADQAEATPSGARRACSSTNGERR